MSETVFRHPSMLRRQIRDVLQFYHPDGVDTIYGGYVAQLDERTGHVYDGETKHLVATARAIHNFSVGAVLDGPVWCRTAAEHGLTFLSNVHWDESREGYDWLLEGRETADDTRYCYGHAFALLAAARAVQADVPGAVDELERAFDVLDERFWDADHGLYADAADGNWESLAPYRGQNANMHACEALLAAFEATAEDRYLDRAAVVAESFVRDVGGRTDGLLWEHFTPEWEPDTTYNEDQPRHQFRPWGYQPGHHAEWAKLLLVLHRHRPAEWLPRRARELFDTATGWWDDEHGGFYYTVDETGDPVVADKYGWAVAEAIGAAALLAETDEAYLSWYDRLWAYARAHFVNPRYGNWYERLTRRNERDGPNRGTAVEPGYHPLNNSWVALRAFERTAG